MKKSALHDLLEEFKPKKSTGSWSKYGGGEYGLDKEKLDKWYCQACGQEQPEGLHGFMITFPGGGFARVCASCFNRARTMQYSYTKTVHIVRYSKYRD